MNEKIAFQDQIPGNHCFGCGPNNEHGLQLKSYWSKEDESVCRYMPDPYHCSGPKKFLNGGIISMIIDCHCICTAIAKGYKQAGRELGSGETIWFATGELKVSFKKPVPIDKEVLLRATIVDAKEKKITLKCTLSSEGVVCVEGNVIAVKVSGEWFE